MNPAKMTCLAAVAAMALVHPAIAQDKLEETRIDLPSNGKSSTYKGTIRGYGSADYVFKAPAGHKLRIDLKTRSTSTYFNVAQDGKDEALFVGSLGGASFDAVLPDDGTYRVKVYQMRNAARRGAKAQYELRVR
jgi:hypothetical protein